MTSQKPDHPRPIHWARKWFGYPTGVFCPTCIIREHPCAVASLLFVASLLYMATLSNSVGAVHRSLRTIESRLGVMEQNFSHVSSQRSRRLKVRTTVRHL